jgi:hypothetical protein
MSLFAADKCSLRSTGRHNFQRVLPDFSYQLSLRQEWQLTNTYTSVVIAHTTCWNVTKLLNFAIQCICVFRTQKGGRSFPETAISTLWLKLIHIIYTMNKFVPHRENNLLLSERQIRTGRIGRKLWLNVGITIKSRTHCVDKIRSSWCSTVVVRMVTTTL